MQFCSCAFQELNGKWYVDLLTKILATGKIKPNPVHIYPNGLASVKGGLQDMEEGKVIVTCLQKMVLLTSI